MPYELSVKRERGFLRILARGRRTREAVVQISMEILEACRREGVSRVLVDVRDFGGRLDTLDAYEIPATDFPRIREAGVIDKAAIVDLEEFEADYRFFETVARNRGFRLRIFGDEKRAEDWLLQGTDPG